MAKLAAVWNKAFSSGSKSLQDRLKKVHANNPEFQSWLKSSGHGAGESVKQASKEVKSTARVKSLQQKSLKAYGATKGTRMGSEDGSGEAIRDTIAPLTRDQHAKVQAAEREAKAAAKKAAPAAPKKPLSTSQRLSAIAAAVRKAKAKHDVPTMEPDDEGHDDLRDVHQSLHIRSGYNEEVEQVDEGNMRFDPEAAARPKSSDVKNFQMRDTNRRAAAASKKYIRRMTKLGGLGPNQTKKDTEAHMKAHFGEETGADKRDSGYKMSSAVRAAQKKSDELSKEKPKHQAGTLAVQKAMEKELQYNPKYRMEEVEQIEEGNPENKAKKKEYVRGVGLKAMKAGKVDPARGHIPQRAGREELRKEEVEQIEEVTKKEAETALGGPVKTMTGNEPKGKLPLGFRKARGNARKAAKAAETAIKLAKGRVNKVNTEPELNTDNNGK